MCLEQRAVENNGESIVVSELTSIVYNPNTPVMSYY